jgi:hypothetical protein
VRRTQAPKRASAPATSSPAACSSPPRGVVVCGPAPVVYVVQEGGPPVALGIVTRIGPGRLVRR